MDDASHVENETEHAKGHQGLTRAKALGAGAAAFAGLTLGGALRPASARADDGIDLVQQRKFPIGNITLLPSSTAAEYFQENLLNDTDFFPWYNQLAGNMGFDFIPERALLAIGISPPADGERVAAPYSIAIIPGIAGSADIRASSHDVVSIVVLRQGTTVAIVASKATVSHRPYETSQFVIYDTLQELVSAAPLVSGGGSGSRTVSRDVLAGSDPSQLASQMGAPNFATDSLPMSGPGGADAEALSAAAFDMLLKDQFSKQFYPRSARQQLAGDTPLLQKWSSVNELRYALFSPGGGTTLAKSGGSGSCSSSCYGCTSTSCCWGHKSSVA